MDPVQELQKALSLPEDSPQQIQLLSSLREFLEQQPAPITVIIPPLLHTIVPAKDSAFKRWVVDILHFGLSRSSLPGEMKAQCKPSSKRTTGGWGPNRLNALFCEILFTVATSTLEDITNLLNDPSLSIQKSVIQCFASSLPLMFRVLYVAWCLGLPRATRKPNRHFLRLIDVQIDNIEDHGTCWHTPNSAYWH